MSLLKKACQSALNIIIGIGLIIIIVGSVSTLFVCIVDTGFFGIGTIVVAVFLVLVAHSLGKMTEL